MRLALGGRLLTGRPGIARRRAVAEAPGSSLRFVEGDLTAPAIAGVEGPFDLLIDFGTLDDLDPDGRLAMARVVARLPRPGRCSSSLASGRGTPTCRASA